MFSLQQNLDKAVEIIKSADGLLIAAGAGMGIDSGMPDFRGSNGTWTEFKKTYPGLKDFSFYDIASGTGFSKHPALSWGFYGQRLNFYRETAPHAGFNILLKLGLQMKKSYFVYTSNVDGHFQKAGFRDVRIHECHGTIHRLQCNDDCRGKSRSAENFKPIVDKKSCMLISKMPMCSYCKRAIERPNILMFNDWTWNSIHADESKSRLDSWLASVKNPAIIELGAGIEISTVRDFTTRLGNKFRERVIRINPNEPQIHRELGIGIAAGALEALVEIEGALNVAA